MLEAPADALPGNLIGSQARERVPVEQHLSFLVPVDAANAVEQGRFPCAVRTDHRDYLLVPDADGYSVEGLDSTEAE